MEKCEIWQLVDEALQLWRAQAITIPYDPRDCELLRSPRWCRAVEADVGCLATDVMAGPGGRDVLGIGRYGALEALDDEVRAVQPLVWEA